uniref:Uncharacterized protein n=1 Tax=Chromera velia CCMP2878 TaxID=1169474 RepID=A0A0G4FTV4_9ALVE|eukprot:Cvel_18726.t1-p1 / transcript=Cvel_18726.t1 / gene=Cvel_18726 / organism=Chromera_velia_CCMP2878 / gene_product=Serine/threonine-protein phosphatase 6 regulatory, putative / transcript_product=Serine/threonine-protein phosphatase 6 regulatory, putative / location=Cvel_scaffold1570:9987-11450(+) / protein_length=488 / sequence_SO=supercontig / SO=protein_coding / is_pseudo=false
MAENSPSPAPTTDSFLSRLDALEASLVSSLHAQFEMVRKSLKAGEKKEYSNAAAAAAVEVQHVHPNDMSCLERLEETGKKFLRKIREDLHPFFSRRFEIDLGFLLEQGIGEAVRAFRAVEAEILREALSEFLSGASNGETLRLYLKVGADVNGLVECKTALIRAVIAANMAAVEMLVEDGADLEGKVGVLPEGGIQLTQSVQGGGTLFTGDTALIVACRLRRWVIVKYLVAKGANVEACDWEDKQVLEIACEAAEGELDAAPPDMSGGWRLSYDPQNGNTEVRSAVSDALKELVMGTSDVADIRISVRPHSFGDTLVHFFSWHEFEGLVLLCLSKGVQIDYPDSAGYTPLHNAAARAKPASVEFLIANGADFNRREEVSNGTALTLLLSITMFDPLTKEPSFISSVLKVLEILLDRGVDVNARGGQGNTALHEAARWGVAEVVRFLIDRGADLQAPNTVGETPLAMASNADHEVSPEVVELLRVPTTN